MRASSVVYGARIPPSLTRLMIDLNVHDVVEIALHHGSVQARELVRAFDLHRLPVGPIEVVLVLGESERVLYVLADDHLEVLAVSVRARDLQSGRESVTLLTLDASTATRISFRGCESVGPSVTRYIVVLISVNATQITPLLASAILDENKSPIFSVEFVLFDLSFR